MKTKITKIELPQQTGCQHLHVFLEDETGNTERRDYHITDFTSGELTQSNDEVYVQVKTLFRTQGLKTREEMKNSFLNLTLEK